MTELKEKVAESKLKLLEKVNAKLEDKDLTAEEMVSLSMALQNLLGFSDYAEKILTGGFNGGCTTPSETNKTYKE